MGIFRTLLFFAALVYLLVRFAGWLLRFLKKNPANDEEGGIHLDIPERDIDFAFPGGDAEIEAETEELYLLLLKAHPKDLVRLVLVGGAVYFAHLEDKSEGKMVAYLQQLSGSAFSPPETVLIHNFLYTRVLRLRYQGQVDEDEFDAFVNDVHELTGCDADQVPGGYGAFGFAITNPVPVKGVISNEYYLSRLRTAAGKRITWERVGSRQSPQSGKPVDLYRIFDLEETEIARLFIDPYHKRVSNHAPEGFKLLTRADAAIPRPTKTETTFTQSGAPAAEEATSSPGTDDWEPAAAMYVTTDGEGNQESQVLDARLLAANVSLLAAWAALLQDDQVETRQQLADTVDHLDGFPGPDDANTVRLLAGAAQLSAQLEDAPTADRLLERAAKARGSRKAADKERLSDAQYELGRLFITQMNPGQAEKWLRPALGTRQALLGAKHEKTAQCLAALGLVLEPVPEEAEKMFRQALPLYHNLYGTNHPQTALVLSGLARALYRQHKTAEALPLAEKAHAIYLDNPDEAPMVQNLSTLAMLYKRHKRLTEAEGLQRQLVALLEKDYGPHHQGFGVELGNLAGILVEKGEDKEAAALFYRSLFIKEEGSPPQSISIAHTLTSLAGLHAKNGEFSKAEPLAKRAYVLRAESLGEEHPQTRESFSLLQKIRADRS